MRKLLPKFEKRLRSLDRTICSNRERSEQFLVFLTCSWSFLSYDELEQLEFKLEKLLGFRNMQEKLQNVDVSPITVFFLKIYLI